MIPEFGQLCLSLAFCLAVAQAVLPLAGAQWNRSAWMAVAIPAAAGQAVFALGAFGALAWSFLANDFTVAYVATHSNRALPAVYRFAAVWGGHEGSLLLWIVLLALWTAAVAALSGRVPREFRSRVIGVIGFVSAGFILFVLLTSNPFLRLLPAPIDGNDLNPLLQDPAMALHPPLLYTGYVGFSVAFAFAVAAMLAGRIDQQWARWARPWTTAAWAFLTLGIALGSWWAYYELGWGGWWFWDPVENASFMPWLVGTALIHSLAVTEKRGLFKGTTLLLAIGAFSLSLLGTFLVRSGVLVSVHAFASDPARGLFILGYLAVVIGVALLLYAWRAPRLDRDIGFKAFSRETFLLVNNLLLSVAAGLILLGTLYPLVLDALGRGKISVGPPYFETVFLIPMLPLLFAVGVGMHTAWRAGDGSAVARRLRWPALAALLAGTVVPWLVYGSGTVLTAVGVVAAAWLVLASLLDPLARIAGSGARLTRGALGMQMAHLGLGLSVLGIVITSSHSIVTDQRIAPGETLRLGTYELTFRGTTHVEGPNYLAERGEMALTHAGAPVAVVYPEKRTYRGRESTMTEAGIDARWHRDLFVALGEDLGDGAWSVRLQYKPMVRFIWIGALVMACGGLLAISDRRYRAAVRQAAGAQEAAGTRPA
ncbi:MAG: heme lyase CcmF/NrfE family subunit [Gammaproteobacteria bacterium]|nr:heme lyase CcmF/NrfE family subunit [Gammaproteobacteria bacterium]